MKQIKKRDVLVVWKLDRLGRSLGFLIDMMERLKEKGAGFQSLSDEINTTTAGGKLIFHIMGALAEFERALIIERTKAGLAAAKRRGKFPGKPRSLPPNKSGMRRKCSIVVKRRRGIWPRYWSQQHHGLASLAKTPTFSSPS